MPGPITIYTRYEPPEYLYQQPTLFRRVYLSRNRHSLLYQGIYEPSDDKEKELDVLAEWLQKSKESPPKFFSWKVGKHKDYWENVFLQLFPDVWCARDGRNLDGWHEHGWT